ncbi:E3 SUMO-protein ligase ZBED1-like [Dysidea avara]|uniref:E3 SUMO-protein ligase ZBED1-like n=1 Tax=Dysidea avara TaxID=196820 RepID=UPI003326529C
MDVLRLACAGHTLNLAVQKALQIPQVSTPLARCRKLVSHFHKSRVDSDEFKKNQLMFSDIPKHKLIHDVATRWNSTYDMIERVCEQQLPISSVLLQRRDSLMHLELLPNEWRILEDVVKLLRPFKIATQHLSGEEYPTISTLGPLLHEIQIKTAFQDDDSVAVKAFKKALQDDMDSRYTDPNIKFLMYKSSFLDPRFKTLTHLSSTAKQEIFDWVVEDILNLNNDNESNDVQIECVTTTESSEPSTSSNSDCNGPTRKKKKKSALMELIGDKFQSENEQTTDTTTFKDIVHSELLRYKTEPSISVDHPPLHWWSVRRHLYPNVSKLACKYLCVVATSVPSEQLFSTAGNVVSVKRAALLPENVEKLIFLHDNLPPVSLPYRRCVQDEACDCDSCNA